MQLADLTFENTLGGLAVLAVLYTVAITIWRLYFSPLASFPGSKLAASTLWYEFYWDVVKGGQWVWKIQEMHKQYGPIVRINPYELHILDSEYYEELYSGKKDKYKWWTKLGGADGSSFAAASHEQHRLRKSAVAPFFSKRSITDLEPIIAAKVDKLSTRFDDIVKTGEVVRLDVALMALTIDIICDYAFDADRRYLDEPDFKLQWKETLHGVFQVGAINRHFPWILPLTSGLPLSVVSLLDPGVAFMLRWQNAVRDEVKPILNGKGEGRTIFHALRDSSLPPEEKTLDRLCDEAAIFTGAGSETTAMTVTRIMFFLHNSPEALSKLKEELWRLIPNARNIPKWNDLTEFPYLTAVIQEGIRLSGITARLPRISREPVRYRDWVIPSGTPVSETPYFVLQDASIFPAPEKFRPERWLKDEDESKQLDRYLVTFGKGTRQCVGINLAYAEMYLLVATIVRRFEWTIVDRITLDDAVCNRDSFVMESTLETNGVRVMLRRAE
ncbi:cytochrome P450 [Xylariales sp. PMI_506]|nr:cytochrome P450 [Xylariales sp. PMI_506]